MLTRCKNTVYKIRGLIKLHFAVGHIVHTGESPRQASITIRIGSRLSVKRNRITYSNVMLWRLGYRHVAHICCDCDGSWDWTQLWVRPWWWTTWSLWLWRPERKVYHVLNRKVRSISQRLNSFFSHWHDIVVCPPVCLSVCDAVHSG